MLGAIFVTPLLIPKTHYQQTISAELKKQFNIDVSVENVQLRFFPRSSFVLENLKMSTPGGNVASQSTMLVKKVYGNFSLFHYLTTKRIETSPILEGVKIEYFAGSSLNKAVFVKPPSQAPTEIDESQLPVYTPKTLPATPGSNPQTKPTSNLQAPSFLLQSAFANNHAADSFLTLTTFTIKSGELYLYKDNGENFFKLKNFTLKITNFADFFKNGAPFKISGALGEQIAPNFTLAGYLSMQKADKLVQIKQVKANIAGMRLLGSAEFSLAKQPSTLKLAAASSNVSRQALQTLFPNFNEITPDELYWDGTISLDIVAIGTTNNYQLELQSDASNAAIKFGKIFTKNSAQPLKLSGDIQVTPNYFRIDPLALNLGQSTVTIAGTLARNSQIQTAFTLSHKAGEFEQFANHLPIAKHLSSAQNADLALTYKQSGNAAAEVRGSFFAEKASFLNSDIELLEFNFSVNDKTLHFTPHGKAFGGSFTGNGSLNFHHLPTYQLELIFKEIDSSQAEFIPANFSGQASLILNLQTNGENKTSLLENLRGEANLIMPEIVINDLQLGKQLRQNGTLEIIENELGETLSENSKTTLGNLTDQFTNFKAYAEFSKQTVTVNELSFANEGYKVSAHLTINEQAELNGAGTIDLSPTLTAQLFEPINLPAAELAKAVQLSIPIVLTGTSRQTIIQADSGKFATTLRSSPLIQARQAAIAAEKAKKAAKSAAKQRKTLKKPSAPPKRIVKRKKRRRTLSQEETEEILKVTIDK